MDPLILSMKLVDRCPQVCECACGDVPGSVSGCFGGDLYFGTEGKRVYLTLGQFSLIRLERDAQLLIPAYDYCIPNKECDNSCTEDDPCEIFRKVQFPMDEFFPPNSTSGGDGKPSIPGCGCSCGCN